MRQNTITLSLEVSWFFESPWALLIFLFFYFAAGVGGSVVASRLSEERGNRVLLIEAGVRYVAGLVHLLGARALLTPRCSNSGLEAVAVPYLCLTLFPDTALNWNYTTTPQEGLNGREIPYPRGRLLGGSSSISASPLSKFRWLSLRRPVASQTIWYGLVDL